MLLVHIFFMLSEKGSKGKQTTIRYFLWSGYIISFIVLCCDAFLRVTLIKNIVTTAENERVLLVSRWKIMKRKFSALEFPLEAFWKSFLNSLAIFHSLVHHFGSGGLHWVFPSQHHTQHHHYFVYRYEKDNVAVIHSDL